MMMFARLKSAVNRWPTWWTMFFIFTSQLTLNWQALKGNNCSDVNRINVDGGKIQKSANKWLCRLSIAELCKNSYFVEILSCQSWRVVARLSYLHHPPSLHTVMVAEKQDLSEFEHRNIRFSLFIYSDGNCIVHWVISICVHLSWLLLRLWISIWTKLRYQNSSENKEWLATDKAIGGNLHNNKYLTQCLITFGSEIWYFNHESTLLKESCDIWSVKRRALEFLDTRPW